MSRLGGEAAADRDGMLAFWAGNMFEIRSSTKPICKSISSTVDIFDDGEEFLQVRNPSNLARVEMFLRLEVFHGLVIDAGREGNTVEESTELLDEFVQGEELFFVYGIIEFGRDHLARPKTNYMLDAVRVGLADPTANSVLGCIGVGSGG